MPHWVYRSRRRSILAVAAFAFFAGFALAQSPVERDPPSPNTQHASAALPLRTLTTVRAIHGLSAAEASRKYPVHLRAVVTYFDPTIENNGMAFIQDGTGAIYAVLAPHADWPREPPLPGSLVDVSGTTSAGNFAPIIDQSAVRVLGQSHLPYATPVSLHRLLTGTEDCQWVEIEGVVHDVIESAAHITLQIALADGTIGATTPKYPGVDYRPLIDATVRIRGNAGALFNSNLQMTGSRIYFPDRQSLTIVEPGRPRIMAEPLRPLNSLSRFTPTLAWPHRVHVRGTVTLSWQGRNLCIQDDTQGLCALSSQTTPLPVGSTADLAGFTALAGFRPSLEDAIYEVTPSNRAVPIPVITSDQALQGDHDSELVAIQGQLIGRDIEARDSILVLASGKSLFRAVLPAALADAYLSKIRIGSTLSITGICNVQSDSSGTLQSFGGNRAVRFWILMRSPRDVVILHNAPWWTAGRVGFALLFALTLTFAGIVWVIVLRRRVEQRTRELRESRELYRYMAHHDPLTGLATRVLLHDRLQDALNRAQRFHKSIALLMLDLDKFKDINDYFGHSAGDQVLRETAKRIRTTIRKTDSVARMGGDEFIVLLNDLDHPDQAEQIAAKIVAALSDPIDVGKFQVPMSVSVGVCTLGEETLDAEVLMRRVDAAMYRAKARGRGCFQVFTDDMLAHVPDQSGTPSAPSAQATLVHS